METGTEKKKAYLEGYRILARAESDLRLPEGNPGIRAFYHGVEKGFFDWVEEVIVPRTRDAYLALPDDREKAVFPTRRFRLSVDTSEAGRDHFVIRVALERGDGQGSEGTVAVWNKWEETLLPPGQQRRFLRKKQREENPRRTRRTRKPLARD